MSVELWKSIFDMVAVVTALLAFIAGTGALWTGNILNNRQAEQLKRFDHDLTEAKAANLKLEVKALSLQKEILQMGSRENLLVGDARQRLVDALLPFAGQSVEVRFGVSTFGLVSNVQDPAGPDTLGLANSLIRVFTDAQWNVLPVAFPSNTQSQHGIILQTTEVRIK